MASIDMPMNAAHQHAANADDYLAQGLIVLASAEHSKAAEAYTAAIERSHDESAKRTLRMLYNEHCKAAKELQRKVDKLKEEGKDPCLPQKPELPKVLHTPHNTPNTNATPPRRNTSSPQHLGRPLTESNMGDESFMLLGGQRSDPGDAFNQFWNIMQGMLDNLSQPVAFATIPLGPETSKDSSTSDITAPEIRGDGGLSSDTDHDEPIFSKFSRKIGLGRNYDRSGKTNQKPSSITQASSHSQEDDFDFGEDEDDFLETDDLSGSFFLIPTGVDASPAVLKKENTTLKAEIATLKNRLEGTERVLKLRREQDLQLRDSIFQATREAQRALGSSAIFPRPAPPLELSNTNVPAVPIPGFNTGREAQYAKRIKELEEELRLMKVESDKNKLMIAKFRERWEKLKDSAKRKKEAKVAAETTAAGLRDRIIEEPEAEEELDDRSPRS